MSEHLAPGNSSLGEAAEPEDTGQLEDTSHGLSEVMSASDSNLSSPLPVYCNVNMQPPQAPAVIDYHPVKREPKQRLSPLGCRHFLTLMRRGQIVDTDNAILC